MKNHCINQVCHGWQQLCGGFNDRVAGAELQAAHCAGTSVTFSASPFVRWGCAMRAREKQKTFESSCCGFVLFLRSPSPRVVVITLAKPHSFQTPQMKHGQHKHAIIHRINQKWNLQLISVTGDDSDSQLACFRHELKLTTRCRILMAVSFLHDVATSESHKAGTFP